MNSPFQIVSNDNKKYILDITKWIEEIMTDSNIQHQSYNIMVTQVACNDPNCVPLETFICLIGLNGSKFSDKIPKPLSEVSKYDVELSLYYSDLFLSTAVQRTQDKVESVLHLLPDDKLRLRYIEKIQSSLEEYKIKFESAYLPSAVELSENYTAEQHIAEAISTQIPNSLTNSRTIVNSIDNVKSASGDANNNSAIMDNDNYYPTQPSTLVTMVSKKVSPQDITSASKVVTVETFSSVNNTAQTAESHNSLKSSISTANSPVVLSSGRNDRVPQFRHEKGSTRPRGCPCCDPDNPENIIDQLFLDCPP